MKFRNNIKSRKGFSLLELILVLAAVFVLMAAIFMIYEKVRDQYRVNTIVRQTNEIVANVKNVLPDGPYYEAKNIPAKMLYPKDMQVSDDIAGSYAQSTYGRVYITHETFNNSNPLFGSKGDKIGVEWRSLPSDICLKLYQSLRRSADMIEIANYPPENDKDARKRCEGYGSGVTLTPYYL